MCFWHWIQNFTQCGTHCFHLKWLRIFQGISDKLPIKNLTKAQVQRMNDLDNTYWAFDEPITKKISHFLKSCLRTALLKNELRRRNSCNSSLIRDFQVFWVLRGTLAREEPVPNTRAVIATGTRKEGQRDRIRDRDDPCANLSVPFTHLPAFTLPLGACGKRCSTWGVTQKRRHKFSSNLFLAHLISSTFSFFILKYEQIANKTLKRQAWLPV